MLLYRMSKVKLFDDLTGKGAEISGGRWNEKGIGALYLAENRSLTILETIVHCQRISDLYNRFLLTIDVPDNSIDYVEPAKLPKNWNSTPWNNYTVDYGSKWLLSNKSLLLKIPSAIIPEESIYLINPSHSKHSKIKIIEKSLFLPDNRLQLS